MSVSRALIRGLDLRCTIAGLVIFTACGTSPADRAPGAPATGSSAPAAADATSAPSGSSAPAAPSAPSGSSTAAPGDASGAPAGSNTPPAAPARLVLRPGEALHAPRAETAWNIPGGTVTATVVDVTPANQTDPRTTRLVVWGGGKRFDIVKTAATCDVVAELRHVVDSRLVFQCASRPIGDSPEGVIEDWLIRWSEEKNAPLRNRHWAGDPASTEPSWAMAPAPKTAKRHKKRVPDHRCCCEATLEGTTTHGWEVDSDCKADPDNELSATCVTDAKCRGSKAD